VDIPVTCIFNDCETAFDRTRWALFWTPFGPVLLLAGAWKLGGDIYEDVNLDRH
jgi:hypothetical protein